MAEGIHLGADTRHQIGRRPLLGLPPQRVADHLPAADFGA
jgi:hypothetical protein